MDEEGMPGYFKPQHKRLYGTAEQQWSIIQYTIECYYGYTSLLGPTAEFRCITDLHSHNWSIWLVVCSI